MHQLEGCIEEIRFFYGAHPFFVHLPIKCRVTAGEDDFLSPSQGETTAFLPFHMYNGMNDVPFLKWVHQLMETYGGRPDFVKMNDLTADKMRKLYPNLNCFRAIRVQCDPSGIL